MSIGKLDLSNGRIDITDPCYNRDVWCRMNGVRVLPGKWKCYARVIENQTWGLRVEETAIVHENYKLTQSGWNEFGFIGVDAGLAGFCIDKPDYDNEAWLAYCDKIEEDGYPTIMLTEEQFVTSSGYGDGEYSVYQKTDKDGKIYALKIKFI